MLPIHLLLIIGASYAEDISNPLIEDIFPHKPFECNPNHETYETEFRFLQDLGRGFVHAEPNKIFFEYYFPAEHWVGFSTADQSIEGVKDQCSSCYFKNYYPLPPNANHSNLYPNCIEECLDETIFVATVNSDEENTNNWDIIEFQITAQKSKQLHQKMYRIPKSKQILELWGSEYSPYRENAHFERDIITIGDKEYIHARFWRQYNFAPSSDIDEYDESNEWKPFVIGPYNNSNNLTESDTFCFISIGSFYGGEYPYEEDVLNGMPGFYIDTQHLANIHCYKRDDIKVDCGQDWSFLIETKSESESVDIDIDTYYMGVNNDDTDMDMTTTEYDIITSTDEVDMDIDTSVSDIDTTLTSSITSTSTSTTTTSTTTTTTTTSTTSTSSTSTSSTTSTSTTSTSIAMQPKHDEDCCSAITGISYENVNCLNISKSDNYVSNLEEVWKNKKCGRKDHLPTDLKDAINNANSDDVTSNCHQLWAHFNQIYEICSKYSFAKNMKLYQYFKKNGAYECLNKNTNECKKMEEAIININENDINFNNFNYDDDLLTMNVTTISKSNIQKNKNKKDSELAEIEEDGKATVSTLGVLGGLIIILVLYILYWFCCSYSSKGYRQSSQFAINNGYCDDDIDTEEYDEDKVKLDVINDEPKNNNYYKYDISVNNMDSMPINSDNINDPYNHPIAVNVNNKHKDKDNDMYR